MLILYTPAEEEDGQRVIGNTSLLIGQPYHQFIHHDIPEDSLNSGSSMLRFSRPVRDGPIMTRAAFVAMAHV